MFSIFESRLRSIIDAIREMNSLSLTAQWKRDLESRDTEFWATAISEATSDRVMELLSRPGPPSMNDIKNLPIIDPSMIDPGTYFGFVDNVLEGDEEDADCFAYTGSGTRVARGLGARTSQHSNPEYREKELKKHTQSLFYNVLQDPRRKVIFYLIMTMKWLSNSAHDITITRLIILLAEQVYMIWFGSYGVNAAKGPQKELARLCPCYGQKFPYLGTNLSSPVRNDIRRADKDALSMTPEEQNKRTADVHRQRKALWTKEEKEEAQQKRADYHQRVANPVRRFKAKAKNRGMAKSEIDRRVKAFQKAERLAMQGTEVSTNERDILTST
ncbi:unnamed protein product [Alternaria alternata]